MSYRDEREALHAENESLQRALDETREELEALKDRLREGPVGDPGGAREEAAEARAEEANTLVSAPNVLRGWLLGGALALSMPLLMAAMHSGFRAHGCARAHHGPAMMMAGVSGPRGGHLAGGARTQDGVLRPFSACHPATLATSSHGRLSSSVERSGRVVAASGMDGLHPGSACTVRVTPAPYQEFNCHVELVCDGAMVYGREPTGYAHCDTAQGSPTRARDTEVTREDGDPAVFVDLTNGRMTFSDQQDGQERALTLVVDPDPVPFLLE
ncbi:MAG: hypothetical protein HY909_09955 [Deltaproteobacteria bacterium]|nr:hypothetical protein [Deltaproteobacteria bacterium]